MLRQNREAKTTSFPTVFSFCWSVLLFCISKQNKIPSEPPIEGTTVLKWSNHNLNNKPVGSYFTLKLEQHLNNKHVCVCVCVFSLIVMTLKSQTNAFNEEMAFFMAFFWFELNKRNLIVNSLKVYVNPCLILT